MTIKIRKAKQTDLPKIYELILELAEYEKAPGEVSLSLEQFEQDFRDDKPKFYILLAENKDEILGMAFYFFTYSTWKGKCLYLEDFIIKDKFRRNGIGKKIFNEVLRIAKSEKVHRFAWQVLEWNEPAIKFYENYDCQMDGEWVNCRMTFDQIQSAKI